MSFVLDLLVALIGIHIDILRSHTPLSLFRTPSGSYPSRQRCYSRLGNSTRSLGEIGALLPIKSLMLLEYSCRSKLAALVLVVHVVFVLLAYRFRGGVFV